jgi:pimeloyl-ACP methyl ester carboxylesterase
MVKLKYRILGSGKPILIFHGLFGLSDNWQGFAKQLADKNFQVILGDLRNHGHSPHDPVHNYSAMAMDIANLIDDLMLVDPIVVGHSMGGKATLQLVNDYPTYLKKAIVIDIAPYQYPIHHREILDTLLAVDLQQVKTRGEAEKILLNGIDDLATRQFLLKNLYWRTIDQLAWRFNLTTINASIDEIGASTWPSVENNTEVLFVKGENSGYIDLSRWNEIKQWYPKAQLREIMGAGHWVQAEKPLELLNEILQFLN